MQTSKWVNVRLIDCVMAHHFWVETEMKVSLEEIVFIGCLTSEPMN